MMMAGRKCEQHWSSLLPDNVSELAREVFVLLWTTPQLISGIGVEFLCTRTGSSESEVCAAVSELLELGLVYCTEDERTWAVADPCIWDLSF